MTCYVTSFIHSWTAGCMDTLRSTAHALRRNSATCITGYGEEKNRKSRMESNGLGELYL